jgi:hypothetical protein
MDEMTFVGATFGARRFFFTAFGGERRETLKWRRFFFPNGR